jgi:hypothetical protein
VKGENARSRLETICGEAWIWGQRKMSQVLDAFGLLDFTICYDLFSLGTHFAIYEPFNFRFFFRGCGEGCG